MDKPTRDARTLLETELSQQLEALFDSHPESGGKKFQHDAFFAPVVTRSVTAV